MKKNTKIAMVFTFLSIFVIIIGVVFALLADKERTLQENILIIKNKYTEFSINVVENYQVRTSLVEALQQYSEESYPEKSETFTGLLTTYNETMSSINKNVEILEKKCSLGYDDVQTNIFCENYQQLYESLNNIYVANISNYNDKITKYNQNNETEYELFNPINKEYIDFDKDGSYDGKTTE